MLEIRDFSKTYPGGKRAVDHLSLSVEAGDIFGFIGHNGAGKTTTLRAVAGILDFREGDILIGGHSILEEPIQCKRLTAYLPDNPDIYEHLTGMQYLNFIADIFRVPASERRAAFEQYAREFELVANLGELISSYSHGMKQKLALIAALSHAPRLMVFDEPFVGLDPKAVFTMKEIMRRMCAQGCAVFFSTHVLDVAEKLCNKIAIIREGRLVACGTTDAVRGDNSLEHVFMELIEQ